MSVTSINVRSEREMIAEYADTIAALTTENALLSESVENQSILADTLAREVGVLYRRLHAKNTTRRRRELVAYLIGVTATTVVLGGVYLIASYDAAQILNRALLAVGL